MITNLNKITTRIAQREDILAYLRNCATKRKSRVVALYNSDMDMLIEGKDQDLMVFPVDERLANRAHGIMETGNVKNFRISNLNNHIERLFKSANILGMQVPLSKEQIIDKLNEMAHLAYNVLERENHPNLGDQVLTLKILVSTGVGDFEIFGCDKKPILYAYLYLPIEEKEEIQSVKEYIHPEMWTNPNYFSNAKTVNYLELATMSDYSKSRGGHFGIKTDSKGFLLEGAISNVAFVLKNGQFCHPPLAKTIRGTTLMKAVKYVQDELIAQGKIKEIKEMELHVSELDQINEIFHLSNERIIPIVAINDIQIGNGKVGEIAQYLKNKLDIARQNVKISQESFVKGLNVQQ